MNHAEKIASQIVSGGKHKDNVHVREDRGLTTDVDEELKYGAVQDNRYRPPAKRKGTEPPGLPKTVGGSGADSADTKSATTNNEVRETVEEMKGWGKNFKLETDGAAGSGGNAASGGGGGGVVMVVEV